MYPSLMQFSQTVELTEQLYAQIQADFLTEQHTHINDLPAENLSSVLEFVKRHEAQLIESRIDDYIHTFEIESLSFMVTKSRPRPENMVLPPNQDSTIEASSRRYFIHATYFYKPYLVIDKLDKKNYLMSRAENQQAFLAKQKVNVFPVNISKLAIWSYQKIS